MNTILFDASSTNPVSRTIAVAPGDCVQINAWNLGVGEVAEVFRLLMQPGSISVALGGSCEPSPPVTPADILEEQPYLPCNAPVQVGQTGSQNITTIVLSQPGFYNLHLTPAALGTAVIEAITLTGDEACRQAASACCCAPEAWWAGTSLNACLTITPNGPAGHQPIFNLDACCLLQSLPQNPNPVLSDELVFLSGGGCFRATIDEVFSSAIVCDSLSEQPVLPFAPGDTLVAVDAGATCKRLDAAALVAALETPWTGVSTNPNLTITPGGVAGHAPTFGYDLCADLQTFTNCACEPTPGDQVPIIQAGACVLATWPTTDLCDQIALLANGALIAGDTVPVREAGGACKQVLASTLSTFDGGPFNNQLLGPNGSCALPTYSFQLATSSGMFFDPASPVLCAVGPAVVIGWNNCASRLDVGDSIRLTALNGDFLEIGCSATISTANSSITMATDFTIATVGIAEVFVNASNDFIVNAAGSANLNGINGVQLSSDNQSVVLVTNFVSRLEIDNPGAWNLAGNPGVAGQVITSAGPGLPPVWAAASATVTFPLLAPTSATPQYSFVAQQGMGMAMDGGQLHFGSLDPFSPVWSASSRLSIDTGVTGDMFLRGSRGFGGRGASIDIRGGVVSDPGVQPEGGAVNVAGGDSNQDRGGTVQILGGNSTAVGIGSVGGQVTILSGSAPESPGNVVIRGGSASNVAYVSGGSILNRTDAGFPGSGTCPVFQIDHHNAVAYGDPWVFQIPAFSPFRAVWYGVPGDTVNTRGQDIRIWGGHGLNQGNGGHGGDVHVQGGNGSSGPSNNGGQLFLNGGGLSGTGIKGWVQLECRTPAQGAPTQTPQITSGFAPLVWHDDGTNLHLYGYNPTAGAWQSVMLA